MRFYFLETVYIRFYVDEITLLSFFINSLLYHKKSYVTTYLLKMKLPLRVALPLRQSLVEHAYIFLEVRCLRPWIQKLK
jgi:hypothetical protein